MSADTSYPPKATRIPVSLAQHIANSRELKRLRKEVQRLRQRIAELERAKEE